jgi:hypothetical protein
MPVEWVGIVSGLLLIGVVLMLARVGLHGGALRREQQGLLVCPQSNEVAACRIEQDIRTGQWKQVHSCSGLAFGEDLCHQECTQLMNLGLRLPPPAAGVVAAGFMKGKFVRRDA